MIQYKKELVNEKSNKLEEILSDYVEKMDERKIIKAKKKNIETKR
jgi:hypothetical protein